MNSILIVDDSKAMRSIIRRALGVIGLAHLDIREAADGDEAFAAISSDKPDLVLCDWNMPRWSGLDLMAAMNGAGIFTTVIFVTSEATPQMHQLARTYGVRGVVAKPFTPDMLGRAIKAATRTIDARR